MMKLSTIALLAVVCLCALTTIDAASYFWRADYHLTTEIPVEKFFSEDPENFYGGNVMSQFFQETFARDTAAYFQTFEPVTVSVFWTSRRILTVISVVTNSAAIEEIKPMVRGAGLQYVIDESNAAFPDPAIKIADIKSTFGEMHDECADGKLNRHETDIDCGGDCAPCPLGKKCVTASDCSFNGRTSCVDGVCGSYNSTSALSLIAVAVITLLAVLF